MATRPGYPVDIGEVAVQGPPRDGGLGDDLAKALAPAVDQRRALDLVSGVGDRPATARAAASRGRGRALCVQR